MRAYPLCRVERSFDGQRFELLSHEASRTLFDELTRCWCFVPKQPECHGEHLTIDGAPFVPETPQEMVDAVVRALERGGAATLHFSESFVAYLRRSHYVPGRIEELAPIDYSTRDRMLGLHRR